MEKLTIAAYTDELFRTPSSHEPYRVQVNPARFTHKRQVNLLPPTDSTPPGVFKKFEEMEQGTLSFELTIDGTGIIDKVRTQVGEEIRQLQTILYTHEGQIHPNFVQITWGEFLFNGILTDMSVDYTLFKPDGSPLRVSVFLIFLGFTNA